MNLIAEFKVWGIQGWIFWLGDSGVFRIKDQKKAAKRI